ncbi:mediator of RNA polymerase II transcription subunit 31-like protein [Piromyces finnis]|uniref:Mediator of RNA polymerase II transcription subunit 31 n=1 Tax=Piromyces finnis TaxID=1754191 RepID=A0A1Y1UWD0_9FUNG|nr:mediator of RNA polymerase II transcription subunit 31-like protein [Piromyces finnis]|eukprot:ORX41791.1 mediator of RNA polymerase II transcription subunit 31-like protein [Piromyces finnis]
MITKEDKNKERFQLELEFIQMLSNPLYLHWLAQEGYFNKPEFINYLEYLKYWKNEEYSKFIMFPYCLAILDLLQHKEFRDSLANNDFALNIHKKQFNHWKYYRYNKNRSLKMSF